jgi:hypothetical protein
MYSQNIRVKNYGRLIDGFVRSQNSDGKVKNSLCNTAE